MCATHFIRSFWSKLRAKNGNKAFVLDGMNVEKRR